MPKYLRSYRCLLNYVLQALVNKNVNMLKQLYYSKIHLKNIEIYLSKLYSSKYSEVKGAIHQFYFRNLLDSFMMFPKT